MKELIFNNGYGGFDPKTGDYVIKNNKTPSPWCNIITNNNFGTLVTQSGASYTWFGNSTLFRLSPKVDDPLLELSGERLYFKDESSGKIWQPLKCADVVRHCFGYSTFKNEGDLESKTTISVAKDKPLKIIKLVLKNQLKKSVKLSVTYYLQPILGEFPEKTKYDIQSYYDSKKRLIYIKNPGSFYYPEALVYIGSSEKDISYSLDRTEFLGRVSLAEPAGLKNKKLSCKNVTANDPAIVIKTDFILGENQEKTIYFYIGVSPDGSRSTKDISTVDDKVATRELNSVSAYWKNLPVFEIKTPDKALNILVNHWLLYQIVSARLWAKTGFWQPSGAWGFRDQLQDIMSLIWSEPMTVRNHILLAASRQFTTGDVQHWWFQPRGDGIRTTSSDAVLWLIYTINYYLAVTGDKSILEENISFLHSTGKNHLPGAFFVPNVTKEKANLYEHCVLAIDRTLGLIGEHGLPLMLSGDWNDSLSRIGVGKKGESVWMAQFLCKILKEFLPVCKSKKDSKRVAVYQKALLDFEQSLEKTWDGNWYKRAYWDDGRPLGTTLDKYCKIDAMTQSWSVISGTGTISRAKQAMESLEKHLIDWAKGEVRLLTPPFVENSGINPGYIVTYPPGTRENGGTYSHNATWSALAFAILGEGNKSTDILSLLNPIMRSKNKKKADLYLGEPYVMAGDIYTEGISCGQAGWTWYTGSAAVYYKTMIEYILGIVIRKNIITFNPCVASNWRNFSVTYRYHKTLYQLNYENPKLLKTGVKSITHDGKSVSEIQLIDDGENHEVLIVMG